MFRNTLSLVDNNRNIDDLFQRVDFKIIQAISFHNQYSIPQFQSLYQKLKYQQELTQKTLLKLDKVIQYYWQALAQSTSNNYERALRVWKNLQNQLIFARPYLEIGICYQSLKMGDKAIEYYEKCLQKFSNNDMGYYLKGKSLLNSKKVGEAMAQLKIGLGLNSENKYILQTLALFYQEQQNWSVALKYFQSIQQFAPNQSTSSKIKQIHHKQQYGVSKKKQLQNKQALKIGSSHKIIEQPIQKEVVINKKNQPKHNDPILKQQVHDKPPKKVEKIDTVERVDKVDKVGKADKVDKADKIDKAGKVDKQQQKLGVKQVKQIRKKPSNKESQFQKTPQFQSLLKKIKQNPQKGQNYWAIIDVCKDNSLQEKALQFISQLIKNSKRQYAQTMRICRQLEQMYYLCTEKDNIFNLFADLEKNNKLNTFVFISHTYLAILNQDRPAAANAIDSSKIAMFVDQQFQKEHHNEHRHLLQNYLLLFAKLINKQNVDLLSLDEYFKKMMNMFQNCFSIQSIDFKQAIKQQIFLKNLIVQSSNQNPTALLFNFNEIKSKKNLNDIFLKEQIIYIVATAQQFRKKAKKCINLVVFPQSLKKMAKQIQTFKSRFEIYVVKCKQEQMSKHQIQNICYKIKQWNGRIKCLTEYSYNEIWMNLILKAV